MQIFQNKRLTLVTESLSHFALKMTLLSRSSPDFRILKTAMRLMAETIPGMRCELIRFGKHPASQIGTGFLAQTGVARFSLPQA